MKKSDYFGYEFKMMNQFFNQVININHDIISFTDAGLVADLNTGFNQFPREQALKYAFVFGDEIEEKKFENVPSSQFLQIPVTVNKI